MLKRLTFLSFAWCVASSFSLWAQQVQRFEDETPRVNTRIAYFGQNTSEGQLAVDYGQPEWKPEYDTEFDEMTRGKRWRLGANFWTTLDTHLDLTIGGAKVARGYYYLVLERSESDEWFLILLDPEAIRAKKLDAFMVGQTSGGIQALLTWEKTETLAPKLTIKLVPTEGDLGKATLEILWGNHKLTAPIDVSF
jgi:hypothetical protein